MRLVRIAAVVLIIAGAFGLWLSSRIGGSNRALPSSLGSFPDASVVLVTLDTARADRFGCYGSEAGLTPFVDSLAENGIVFDQAQAVAPITLPSHTSMLTGLLPTNHGVRNNGMFSLSEGVETLAEVFSAEGYATGAFVSAQVLVGRYGLTRGFDVYDDDLSKSRKAGESTVAARRGNLTIESALSWLDGVDPDKPVFMWIHLYDPHAPYDPPPEFRTKFPSDPYGAEIAFTDDLVRQLVDDLTRRGRYDNTILSVIADHGESLGEHGEATHGMLLHQATIHVPWVLVTPGDANNGLRVKRPVSGADVAPVLSSLVGIPAPNADRLDGQALAVGDATVEDRDLYYEAMLPMYQYGWNQLRGIRNGGWELIRGTRSELFNLNADRRELVDLADNEGLQLKFLEDRLDIVEENDSTLVMDSALDMTPSEREALEALGYVVTTAAPRRNPPDPRDLVMGHVHVEASRSLMMAGRFDEALDEVDVMLSDDPENLAALNLKGQIYLQTGEFDKAEDALRKALEIDPKGSDIVASLCRVEIYKGNYERAIEVARLGRDTRSPFGTFDALEARCLSALGREEEAVDLIEAALSRNDRDADLLTVRAGQRRRRGNIAESESDLRAAVLIDPYHRMARRNLGQILQETGREGDAVEAYEDLLRIAPGDADALLSIGSIHLKTDPGEAIPYLEEAARLAPGRPIVLTTLGVAYIQANRVPDAEAALKRAVALSPDDPSVRNNLGIVFIQQRKFEEGQREFTAILERNPEFVQARNNLAISLGEMGDLAGAEREARKALQQSPDFLDASLTLSGVLHRAGKFKDELVVLERVSAKHPNRSDLRTSLAVVTGEVGQCERSLELFGELISDDETLSWESHFVAARCLEKVGRLVEALHHFEEAARRSPPGTVRTQASESVKRVSLAMNITKSQ